MKEYYDRRAAEYDATSYGLARAGEDAADLEELERFVAELPTGRMLDIACGTGWLTRFLEGEVVGLDQSEAMLALARARIPATSFVQATIPPLPFEDDSFDTALTAHLYSHLERSQERQALVTEALRVAPSLVVVEQAWRPGLDEELWEERTLRDGSRHRVFKRYYTAERLAAELGGSIRLENPSFVAVSVSRLSP